MSYRKYSLLGLSLGSIIWFINGPAEGQTKQTVTGPEATYWLAADTVTGYGAMGGGFSFGSLMSGGSGMNSPQRLLQLYLGSRGRPAASPDANHLPPAELKVGPALPLLSPEKMQASRSVHDYPESVEPEQPEGRMLIYWGCSEKARAGQPIIFDFSKATTNPRSMFSGVSMTGLEPPSADKFASFGEWPNRKSTKKIPVSGSLVGDHVIKANYAPEIKFTLTAANDFLSPLLPRQTALTGGATMLKWPAIANAKAYFAAVTASNGSRDMVFWSSSEVRIAGMTVPPYLGQAEVTRLLNQKVLMGPQQTECTVPAEVVKAAKEGGMLMMNAFGQEADFVFPARPADPAKPWNIQWRAKAINKATYMGILGDENSDEMTQETSEQQPAATPEKRKKKSIFDKIGGLPF